MTPDEAYYYAKEYGPSKDTREAACEDSIYAYAYAKFVDKKSREDTRNAACKNPEWAFIYAGRVDKCPREDTRNAACKDSEWAYEYAKDIDKKPKEETWEAVKNTKYEQKYIEFINSKMKEEII